VDRGAGARRKGLPSRAWWRRPDGAAVVSCDSALFRSFPSLFFSFSVCHFPSLFPVGVEKPSLLWPAFVVYHFGLFSGCRLCNPLLLMVGWLVTAMLNRGKLVKLLLLST
jgi:hypothetical protein